MGLQAHIPYSMFFQGGNFHELIAICENFTLEILTKSILSPSALGDSQQFMKISSLKGWNRPIRKSFPPRKNLLAIW